MFEFKLPDLGEGVHEGQIVSVLIKEGDTIAAYQPMLEVETDKAAVEIPSPKSGRVARVNVKAGQTVHVGDIMVVIDEAGAAAATTAAPANAPSSAPARAPAAAPAKAAVAAPARAVPAVAKAPAAEAARPGATPAPAPARAAAARSGGGMYEFKLPDLGEGVHEGQIVNVLVKEGEPIRENQPMFEVETDKAAVEIPSPKSGVVAKLNVKPGLTVKVGQVLIVIDEGTAGAAQAASAAPAGRSTPAVAQAATASRAPVAAAAHASSASSAREAARIAPAPSAATALMPAIARGGGPVPAAPVVRKLARELGVDLSSVPASGPNGRVLREDVERAARGGLSAPGAARGDGHGPASSNGGIALPAESLPDFGQYGPVRREKPSQIRKTIARQMTRAWLNVPRVTHGDEVDITELERNRKELNKGLREGQTKITMTAIVLKAVAAALREFPQFNGSYDAAAEEIVWKDYIHIGVAVDSPRGLVVPVVRDVDKKPLPQVASELNDVAERVRTGKFEISELRGASFTVTNVGALGGTFSTPMVNFPEVAIFGLGRALWKPVVLEDHKTIVPRLIMPVFLSFDHRMCDGADAARFAGVILGALANPLRLISIG